MILSLKTHRIAACVLQLLITFSLMIVAIPKKAVAVTEQHEVDALVALHTAWLGNPSSWDTRTDPCDDLWLGIWCDSTHTRVVYILLINQDLAGTISPAIGNLTSLRHLDLSSNPMLGGTLPAEIGKLAKMKRFFVQFCNLSGNVPSEIGNMTSLQYFGLTENAFTGPLTPTVGLLKEIIWLDVSGNNLNGPLPYSTTSGIGNGLDNLTNAIHFHFQGNEFSGSIPSSLFNTKMQLLHLLLDDNKLFGNIPSSISNLLHVEIICLDSNFLNGTIPSTISTITNLTTLQLDNNYLIGHLPDLSNNTKLQILTVGNNPFEPSGIPNWITKLTNLYLLSMDSAKLIGNIPDEMFGFSPHLSNVTLSSNELNGTLDLIAASATLVLVNLTDNIITNVEKRNYTQDLLLNGNPVCVSSPAECTTVPTAVSPNPAPASRCTNDCSSEYVINPKFVGTCQCARPVIAECSFYAIKIPLFTADNITEMEKQFTTGLRDSQFPENLTLQITQTVVEVASSNEVRVLIFPPKYSTVWSSREADLISYALQNQEIQFPSIGPISCEFHGSSYITVLGGRKLSTRDDIGIGVGVAVFVIAILVFGFYALKQKRRAAKAEKMNKPFAVWIATGEKEAADIPQLKGARWFSLAEIRKCTNNFNNEIGEGGYGKVYRGSLSSGEQVAIKRAGIDSLQGATEFKNEIELLSRVHHRNVVALIGFCFEDGEQMLVYEYMPNGTLRECLSGETGLQMDWNTRIGLALDSARGIAYLHTEANPPIIHKDIKSSNILLDEKLVAKVADCGLSKLTPAEDGVAPMSTQVRGTVGYLDPDYYMTSRLTDKSDVYSFGVVLLEMVTGRPPIQGGKHVVLEVRTALAKGGMDLVVKTLVDPALTEYPPKDLKMVVEVALNCVQDNPAERLTMVEVVKDLETLVQVDPAKVSTEIGTGEERSELYRKSLPYMQQNYGSSSFEYTGSFVGISRPPEPQ